MNSSEALNDILALELFLYGGNPPPSCDSYPTMGMSFREIHEVYGGTHTPEEDPEEIIIAYVQFDPKTGKFTEVDPPQGIEAKTL